MTDKRGGRGPTHAGMAPPDQRGMSPKQPTNQQPPAAPPPPPSDSGTSARPKA